MLVYTQVKQSKCKEQFLEAVRDRLASPFQPEEEHVLIANSLDEQTQCCN